MQKERERGRGREERKEERKRDSYCGPGWALGPAIPSQPHPWTSLFMSQIFFCILSILIGVLPHSRGIIF